MKRDGPPAGGPSRLRRRSSGLSKVGNPVFRLDLHGCLARGGRRQGFKKPGHGLPGAGIAEIGRDLVEGNENEGAFGKAGVGQLKTGCADDQIAIEEQVKVERAGAVGRVTGTVAAEFVLNIEEGGEEIARGEMGLKHEDGVREAGLISKADRSGGVERGAGGDASEG